MSLNTIAVDEQGRVAEPVRCFACGYLLRGLACDGDCPECGESLAHSLQPLHFARTRVRPMRRIAAGATLLLIGLVVVGPPMHAFRLSNLWSARINDWLLDQLAVTMPMARHGFEMFGLLLLWAGAYLMTTTTLAGPVMPAHWWPRRAVRWLLPIALVVWWWTEGLAYFGPTDMFRMTSGHRWTWSFNAHPIVLVLMTAAAVSVYAFGRRLAAVAAARRLAMWAGFAAKLLVVAQMVLLLLMAYVWRWRRLEVGEDLRLAMKLPAMILFWLHHGPWALCAVLTFVLAVGFTWRLWRAPYWRPR